MSNHFLEISNLNTFYGRIPMLLDLGMHLEQGKITCVLGANGSGKTTLLKAILGMVKADAGSIFFDGRDITNMGTHKIVEGGISIVASGVGSFPKMTVETNLKMGGYYEKDQKKIQERLDQVYASFPVLKERLNQKAGTLSGGERTMLAIARAIISQPKLIMMDEPSLGLAPIMVEETFAVIKRLNEQGMTILLVEQNADKALEVADRGYVIQKGQIIFEGDREALRTSAFVENPVM